MSLPDVVGDPVHDQVVPLVVLHLLHLDPDLLQLTPDTVLVLEAALHLAYLKMRIDDLDIRMKLKSHGCE